MESEGPFPLDAGVGEVIARLNRLLTRVVELGGSDLHLSVGILPGMRLHGELEPLPGWDRLRPEDTAAVAEAMLTPAQWVRFQSERELDFAYTVTDVGRFRVNLFRQRGSVGAAFRV